MRNAEVRNEQIWLVVGSMMILATGMLAIALAYTRAVMVPFVLAIFITTVVAPIVDYQVNRWRLPKWFAVVTTLFVVLAILAMMGVGLIVAIQSMVRSADEYSSQVADFTSRLFAELHARHIAVDEARIATELEAYLPGVITETAGTAKDVISHGLLISFFVVFLLIGRNSTTRHAGMYAEIETTIRRYLTTMTAISAATSLLVGTVLWAFGLHMAWVFALLVFMLSYIPSIGPIVATA